MMKFSKESNTSFGRQAKLILHSIFASLGITVAILGLAELTGLPRQSKKNMLAKPAKVEIFFCSGDILFVSRFKSGSVKEKVVAFGSESSALYHYLPLVLVAEIDSTTSVSNAENRVGARAAKGGYIFSIPSHALRYLLYKANILDSVVLPVSFLGMIDAHDADKIVVLRLMSDNSSSHQRGGLGILPSRVLVQDSSRLSSLVSNHYPDFFLDQRSKCE